MGAIMGVIAPWKIWANNLWDRLGVIAGVITPWGVGQ
jgi:hypothetical protein